MKGVKVKHNKEHRVRPFKPCCRDGNHNQGIRRATVTPDRDTFEKHHGTPPICITVHWQKYALLLCGGNVYNTHFYHDTPPICIHLYQGAFAEA